ncbi:hypothetical protein M422DRAFT_28506 [Sphaerobolus stellatus SS14]|uniref:Cytochrome P450 n=1 Tax=Sphaerobolus stellatus (strain SS14) TaxID=990650 RepID=A0A0C9W4S5_SPHS4|nr:hypothetical protein M422DRAFT_28506 [Sphaerobolus stellatus SS14]
MVLTPGLRFIFMSVIPAIVGPPVIVHGALLLTRSYYPTCGTWASNSGILGSIYLFGGIIYYYTLNIVSSVKIYMGARRLGARIMPRVRGWLPGNSDLIIKGLTSGRKDYIGEFIVGIFDSAGGSSSCSVETLGDDRCFTRNPKNVQKILATDFENYRKGPFFANITEQLLGTGVFNSDGEMWQFHRKLARPFFSKERVTDFLIYERKAIDCIHKMEQHFDNNLPVDFQVRYPTPTRFTLDSAAEFLFGVSTNSLDAPLPLPYNFPDSPQKDMISSTPSSRFAKAFGKALIVLLDRFDLAHLWPLGEIFEDKMKGPMKDVHAFIDVIIRDAVREHDKEDVKEGESLLSHLLTVTDDTKIITDQTLNILLAGRDTVGGFNCIDDISINPILLDGVLTTYCLAMHPEVVQRLRQEILDNLGFDKAPTYDDIREMKYLRAVLNETLRLYPPALFDDNGEKIYVPPSTRVPYSTLHLQRDPEYWGPDAHIFDPERWLDSRLTRYTSNPFIYVPFNAGPRICLGQQFALNEASYFMIRLLQHFDQFELTPEYQPPHTRVPEEWKDLTIPVAPLLRRRQLEKCFIRSHLTLYADGGLWLRAQREKVSDIKSKNY